VLAYALSASGATTPLNDEPQACHRPGPLSIDCERRPASCSCIAVSLDGELGALGSCDRSSMPAQHGSTRIVVTELTLFMRYRVMQEACGLQC
jgi:hypothetical protein